MVAAGHERVGVAAGEGRDTMTGDHAILPDEPRCELSCEVIARHAPIAAAASTATRSPLIESEPTMTIVTCRTIRLSRVYIVLSREDTAVVLTIIDNRIDDE